MTMMKIKIRMKTKMIKQRRKLKIYLKKYNIDFVFILTIKYYFNIFLYLKNQKIIFLTYFFFYLYIKTRLASYLFYLLIIF